MDEDQIGGGQSSTSPKWNRTNWQEDKTLKDQWNKDQ